MGLINKENVKELEELGFYIFDDETRAEIVLERLGPNYESDYIIYRKETKQLWFQFWEKDDEELRKKITKIFDDIVER